MKNALKLALLALAAVITGFLWDILVWRLHFPYLPFHWLVRLAHADGEAAYTVMMYEMMIFFFLIFLLIWLGIKLFHKWQLPVEDIRR